ncbi:MAG: exodeoxyribonuclease VII small subunit [Anaerolineae bacterium]|jgi:exodeoxyribonuclease VII small subunit
MSDELEALSFEQAVGELEGTVERLEEGDLSLADAIALYERGMRLVQHCNDLLDAAELQVQTLAEPGSISET